MRTLCVLAVCACACGGKSGDSSEATGSGGEPAKPPAGFETLKATVDGKPVVLGRGFIKRVSPDHWRILVGDTEGSCEELLSGVTNKRGGTSFVATIAKRVAPDGAASFAVTDFWSAGHPTEATFDGAAGVEGAADRGRTARVVLPKIVDDDQGKKLVVEGAFTATGCGDQAAPEPGVGGIPKAAHVSAASITIAGHKLPVVGAILRGTEITLSTGPKDCTTVLPFAQVILRHQNGAWELSGTWIPKPKTETDTGGGMNHTTFKVGVEGKSDDGAVASVEIGGSGTIGGYEIGLAGTVEAIDCAG